MGERLKTESIKALEPKSWRAVDILQKSHFGATRRVVSSGMVRRKSHCRMQWVNLADLEIIYGLGDHSLLNKVNNQCQAPTEVDMLVGQCKIRIQQCLYLLIAPGIVPLRMFIHQLFNL